MNKKENGFYQKYKQKGQKKYGPWTKSKQPQDLVEAQTQNSSTRESSPNIPSLGTQLSVHAELDKLDTPASFVWGNIRSLAPFVKKPILKSERSKTKKIRIGSKNETEEATALKMNEWIQGKVVILSHSATPLKNEQHCRAVVDAVEYSAKKIEVTVSADACLSLWEDTDIWILPASETPSESPYSLEPNTSTAFEPTPDEPAKPPRELNQSELFQSIHSWKYQRGTFQRMRRKFGDKWKNVYLTELQMTPVDKNKKGLLKFVKESTMLKLSNDIDEVGDIFVEVCRKAINEKEKTITVAIVGFTRSDVDIPLSKETTYYLTVDEGEDDEWGSLSSEDGILPGYQLEQNPDELCEKLGELKVVDACVKTWFSVPNNLVFIRLAVTAVSRKMQHFKKLHGLHVIIQSTMNDKEIVLATVSRVLKDEMVLTLRAVPRSGEKFFVTKDFTFTIHIDHNYEDRLKKLKGLPAKIDKLSRQFRAADSDLRLVCDWRRLEGTSKRTYASFFCKNPAIKNIPISTVVLLSKGWEFEGQVEKKADFVFAVRIEDEKAKNDPHMITFEIKFSKALVHNSAEFLLSKAFYYMDFDSSDSIINDPDYTLLDARCASASPRESVVRSCKIGAELEFYVFEFVQWKRMAAVGSQASGQCKSSRDSLNNATSDVDERKSRSQSRPPPQSHPLLPSNPPPQTPSLTWKSAPRKTPQNKYLDRGIVYFSGLLTYDKGQPLVVIRVGFNRAGEKIELPPWNIGKRLVLTEELALKTPRITGNVYDTKGEKVTVVVDKTASDLDFLHNWSKKKHLMCFEER